MDFSPSLVMLWVLSLSCVRACALSDVTQGELEPWVAYSDAKLLALPSLPVSLSSGICVEQPRVVGLQRRSSPHCSSGPGIDWSLRFSLDESRQRPCMPSPQWTWRGMNESWRRIGGTTVVCNPGSVEPLQKKRAVWSSFIPAALLWWRKRGRRGRRRVQVTRLMSHLNKGHFFFSFLPISCPCALFDSFPKKDSNGITISPASSQIFSFFARLLVEHLVSLCLRVSSEINSIFPLSC